MWHSDAARDALICEVLVFNSAEGDRPARPQHVEGLLHRTLGAGGGQEDLGAQRLQSGAVRDSHVLGDRPGLVAGPTGRLPRPAAAAGARWAGSPGTLLAGAAPGPHCRIGLVER
jgi:hypothetical protein